MTPKKSRPGPAATPSTDRPPRTAPTFQVSLTEEAEQDLAQISNVATQRAILRQALQLRRDPLHLGQPLTGPLKHFRSLRAAGQRSRIIYQVALNAETRAVVVVIIGIRKDGDRRDASAVASKRLK